MKVLTYLPKEIKEKGITFERVLNSSKEEVITDCKAKKIRYRTVKVLARNLRNRTNLHNQPYKPTVWIFREKKLREE